MVAGSSTACNLLAERFAPPSATGRSSVGGEEPAKINGVEQLALHLAVATSPCIRSQLCHALCLPSTAGSGTFPALVSGPDTLVGLLAGIPDRSSSLSGGGSEARFRAQTWLPSVISCLLEVAETPSGAIQRLEVAETPSGAIQRLSGDEREASGSCAVGESRHPLGGFDERPAATALDVHICVQRSAEDLLVALIDRLCVRGHASSVAVALIARAELLLASSVLGASGSPASVSGASRSPALLSEPLSGSEEGGGPVIPNVALIPPTQYTLEATRVAGRRASSLRKVVLETLIPSGLGFERLLDEVLQELTKQDPLPLLPQPLPSPKELYRQYAEQYKGRCDEQPLSDSAETGSRPESISRPLALLLVLLGGPAMARSETTYLLTQRMLLSRTLPTPVLLLMLDFLGLASRADLQGWLTATPSDPAAHPNDPSDSSTTATEFDTAPLPAPCWDLSQVAASVSRAWGDPLTLSKLPLSRQGFLSHLLALLLSRLGPDAMQRHQAALLPWLLQGVSARLGSNLTSQRRQAVRLGSLFSRLLDPLSDLFADQEADWVDEEIWEGAFGIPPGRRAAPTDPPPRAATAACQNPQDGPLPSGGLPGPLSGVDALAAAESRGPDSDDESDDDDDVEEDDGLPSFDVTEDPEAEAWAKADPRYEGQADGGWLIPVGRMAHTCGEDGSDL